MKTHHQQQQQHPKLKPPPRPLFSCAFFRHCTTQSPLSPTAPNSPSLPLPPPPPPQSSSSAAAAVPSSRSRARKQRPPESSSSSSSSSASHSFTQWRFPLDNNNNNNNSPVSDPIHLSNPSPAPPPPPPANLLELFHAAELQLSTGSESDRLSALHLLERFVVPNPPADPVCPPELMRRVVANLRNKAAAKAATKILLALCLAEPNRHVAVEAVAVGTIVEVAMELEGPAAERGLAALELACTVEEGAAALRSHALAVPVMVSMMGKMSGRGQEYAISALAVIYGGGGAIGGGEEGESANHAPPEEVARAVELTLEGECTARGRRKGVQLLKALEEYGRRSDVATADDVEDEEKRRILGTAGD
ncbi:U-box domain-containing protein 26 [Linum perenne]